ncbi:MAG: DNA gyrase inhibitor YacG [Nitrospirota bacterium]
MSAPAPCPICRTRTADPAHAPFCGARCRDVDMGQWLSGTYRVPSEEPAQPDASDPSDGAEHGGPDH